MLKICSDCSKSFATNQQLVRHNARKNKCTNKMFEHCGVVFTRRTNYEYHINNKVCLRKVDDVINRAISKEPSNTRNELSDETRLRVAEIELEHAKILLELEKLRSSKNNINIDKVTVNVISIGKENLDALDQGMLRTMSFRPKDAFTDFGIKQLYFNKRFPENQLIQAKDPTSKRVKIYDGITWTPILKEEAAEQILIGLVEAVKRRFKELPKDNQELDVMFDHICNYIYDQIEDSDMRPGIINEVVKNMFKHYSSLKSD